MAAVVGLAVGPINGQEVACVSKVAKCTKVADHFALTAGHLAHFTDFKTFR